MNHTIASIFLRTCPAIVVGLVSLMPLPEVHAAVVSYNNRSVFNSATDGLSTISFEGLVVGTGYTVIPSPAGITLQGVNFNDEMGNLIVAAPINYSPTGVLASNGATLLRITLPSGTNAVGFDFALAGGAEFHDIVFRLPTGETYLRSSISTIPISLQFFGVTSSTPIPYLLVSTDSPTSTLVVDNVSFSSAPEPGSCALLAATILPLAAVRFGTRYRKRRL